ncbi:MAG TPA: non-homologous end-joining DNA ligase [Tepidisphaeraceae bacterium]|nr:non-homologous end-joining DNA ligase [Tepidisphaeraceae bacterium]
MARASSTILARRVPTVRARRTSKIIDPVPATIAPMLAVGSDLPSDPRNYTFEFKWDGVRAICYHDGSSRNFRIESRNQLDITRRYPELHALADALGKSPAILDGEIVSLDDAGRPSFAKLQHRMHLNGPSEIVRLSKSEPVFYVLFDVLYTRGRLVLNEPYSARREMLQELTLAGAHWQITPAHVGEGKTMLDAARRNGLEGLVAKRLDSIYIPGKRSPAWRKIKIIQRQEFVIGGYIPEKTGASNRIGALLTGYYDCDGKLRFAGKVGTGLSAADHAPLLKQLTRHPIAKSPFADPVPRGSIFNEPTIVAEIEYRRWPEGGSLQHASYKGLRMDKNAREVVKEPNLAAKNNAA